MTDGIQTLPIDLIDNGTRLRGVNDDHVLSLSASIEEVGLISPISVYRRKVIRRGIAVDGFGLIAGLHRKEACSFLGMDSIPAQILEMEDLRRQIAECDENLIGPTLTPSEKAMFTRRRKEAYEALHGSAKAKGAHAANASMGNTHDANAKFAEAFTRNTAGTTGQSERLVQLNAERGENITPEAMEAIRGTKLDTGVYLDTIKNLPPDTQAARVAADLAAPKPKAPTPLPSPPAPPPTQSEIDDIEEQKFWNAWAALSLERKRLVGPQLASMIGYAPKETP